MSPYLHMGRNWVRSALGVVLFGALCFLAGAVVASLALVRVSSGTPFTDSFTRAAGALVGNGWGDTGIDNWSLVSNAPNLLTNPGFESCTGANLDPPSWTVNEPANSGCYTFYKRTGAYSVYVNTATTSLMYQAVSLTAGTSYTLSGYAAIEGAGASAYMTLTSGSADTGTNYCTTNSSTTLNGSYTLISCTYVATSTGTAYVNLRGSNLAAGRAAEFDDLVLVTDDSAMGYGGAAGDDIYQNNVDVVSLWEDYSFYWDRPSSSGYSFAFRRQADAGLAFYQLTISGTSYYFYKYTGGAFTILQSWTGASASGTDWYKVSARGYNFSLYQSDDGVVWNLIGDVYDPMKTSSHGLFGFRDGIASWEVDDVIYRDPGITLKGAALDAVLEGVDGKQDVFNRADSETVGGFWTDDGSNTWRINGNTLYNDTATGTDALLTDSTVDYYDVGVFSTIRFIVAGEINQVIRATVADLFNNPFYQISISNTGSIILYKYTLAGGFVALKTVSRAAFTLGSKYELYVTASGSTIRVMIAPEAGLWTQYIEYTDTGNTAVHGGVGWRDNTESRFENVQVLPFSHLAMDADSPDLFPTGGPLTVNNSGFESCTAVDNDPPSWTNNSATNTGCYQASVDAGSWSAYIRTSSASIIYQSSIATPFLAEGIVYVFSGRVRASPGGSTYGAYLTVSSAAADAGTRYCSSSTVTSASWTTVTCTFTAPQDQTVYLNLRGSALTSSSTLAVFDTLTLASTVNPSIDLGNNLYAPEIVSFNGLWRRYFGAQRGQTGKDAIYAQTSTDTRTWSTPVLVLDTGTSGQWDDVHVNDPSAVVSGSTLYLYYTGAGDCTSFCNDQVGLATSTDGTSFSKSGSNPVITKGGAGSWNERLVGRPSMIIDGATWRAYVDGQDEPLTNAAIGLWTSTDGIAWTPDGGNPIYDPPQAAAAHHVVKYGSTYYLFNQGVTRGTWYATGSSPTSFTDKHLIAPPQRETVFAAGQVTPQFFQIGSSQRLYVGASQDVCQCEQRMLLFQFFKKVEALTGTRNLVKRLWAVNDTDVQVELEDVGSATVNLHGNFSRTSSVISTITLSDLNWGDVLGASNFPVPYQWWQRQRALDPTGAGVER